MILASAADLTGLLGRVGCVPSDGRDLYEAALVIAVPEAEQLVRRFRLQYDPSARLGVPAHITINYPFLPGVDPAEELPDRLADLFGGFGAFDFSFNRVDRFPDVLYLPPEPDEPFKQLIHIVEDRFPDSPPYGGEFEEIVPHLTVAQSGEDEVLEFVGQELERISREHFPLLCRADQVWLMDNRAGTWRKRATFKLGRS